MAKYTGSSHAVALVMTGNQKGNRHWVEKPQHNTEAEKRRAADSVFLLLNSSKLAGGKHE